MQNIKLNSLTIDSKKPIKELMNNRYTAPLIVEGGSLFKNGISLGYCDNEVPHEGSICYNNNKFLFFTNNNWFNMSVNGLQEFNNHILNESKMIILNFNIYNKFYLKYYGILESHEFYINLNSRCDNKYMQDVQIVIENEVYESFKILLKTSARVIHNKKEVSDKVLAVEDSPFTIFNLKIYNNTIIID